MLVINHVPLYRSGVSTYRTADHMITFCQCIVIHKLICIAYYNRTFKSAGLSGKVITARIITRRNLGSSGADTNSWNTPFIRPFPNLSWKTSMFEIVCWSTGSRRGELDKRSECERQQAAGHQWNVEELITKEITRPDKFPLLTTIPPIQLLLTTEGNYIPTNMNMKPLWLTSTVIFVPKAEMCKDVQWWSKWIHYWSPTTVTTASNGGRCGSGGEAASFTDSIIAYLITTKQHVGSILINSLHIPPCIPHYNFEWVKSDTEFWSRQDFKFTEIYDNFTFHWFLIDTAV